MSEIKHYGGWGGLWETTPWESWADDAFAQALYRACGERIKASREDAVAAWSAMANVDWTHTANGVVDAEASYSFRAAGDLVASLRGEGMYMDWYCSGPYATVAEWISEAMVREGWTHKEDA